MHKSLKWAARTVEWADSVIILCDRGPGVSLQVGRCLASVPLGTRIVMNLRSSLLCAAVIGFIPALTEAAYNLSVRMSSEHTR